MASRRPLSLALASERVVSVAAWRGNPSPSRRKPFKSRSRCSASWSAAATRRWKHSR